MKSFLESEEGDEIEGIYSFIETHDSKMCHKCYSAYERYQKLHDTIQANLSKASGLMDLPSPSITGLPQRKRPRMCGLPSVPPQGQAGCSAGSPDVQVSVKYQKYI